MTVLNLHASLQRITFLFVDGDIVLLRSPAKHLRDATQETSAHLIMQFASPKNVNNTGFWFARSEPLVLEIFKDMQNCLIVDKTLTGDQKRFNEIIRHRDKIKIYALDAELFACGNQFLGTGLGSCLTGWRFCNAELALLNHLVTATRHNVGDNSRAFTLLPCEDGDV